MRRLGLTLALAACGPIVGDAGGASTTTDAMTSPPMTSAGTSSSSSETDATSPPAETTAPQIDDTSTTDEVTSAEDGAVFIEDRDGGSTSRLCDPWAQDCPRGEKCMPWANDSGNSWNATRCTPIDPDPRAVGETCTVIESGVSGIDDCAIGAMCWGIDPETLAGVCVAFCNGNAFSPSCADPCTSCRITNDGVLILCSPQCNPITQDCSEGQACRLEGDAFRCVPDARKKGQYGDPCGPVYDCDVGLVCAEAEDVPGCDNEDGCCTPVCDVDAGDACDSLQGTACVPWFEQGEGIEGCLEAGTVIGACMVPR